MRNRYHSSFEAYTLCPVLGLWNLIVKNCPHKPDKIRYILSVVRGEFEWSVTFFLFLSKTLLNFKHIYKQLYSIIVYIRKNIKKDHNRPLL